MKHTPPQPTAIGKAALLALVWALLLAGAWQVYQRDWIKPAYQMAGMVDAYWARTQAGAAPLDRGLVVDPDGGYWVHLLREGALPGNQPWRVRRTEADGPPGGREVRWGMLNLWWLKGLTALGGDAMSAAAWSGPILLALGLAGFALALALGGNGAGAVLLTAVMVWGSATYKDFGFGFPDHHGWHQWAALGLVLALGMRWMAPIPRRGVLGGWGHFSAFSGAAILWLGASQAVLIYGSVCAGAGLALLVETRRRAESPTLPPEFWRWWGLAGAAWGLLFYLVENAPNYFSTHLEVNHPAYLLLWAAAGEALCRWARALRDPGRRGDWLVLGLCALPILGVGLLLRLAPETWLFSRNPAAGYMMSIMEEGTRGIPKWSSLLSLAPAFYLIGAVLSAAGIALLAGRPRMARGTWSALLVLTVSAFILTAFAAFWQERWLGQATALTAGLAALLATALPREGRWTRGKLVLAIGAVQLIVLGAQLTRPPEDPKMLEARASRLIGMNELAELFQKEAAAQNLPAVRLLNTPLQPMLGTLHLYSPVRQLGTPYWENFVGHLEATRLLAEEDEAAALAGFKRLGLTHVIVSTVPEDMTGVFILRYGRPEPRPRALAMRLANPARPTPPAWLTPVPGTDSYFLRPARLKIYRFTPPPE
jgi:hypothetical protein